jgi:hypothetical protein
MKDDVKAERSWSMFQGDGFGFLAKGLLRMGTIAENELDAKFKEIDGKMARKLELEKTPFVDIVDSEYVFQMAASNVKHIEPESPVSEHSSSATYTV